ncbi:1-pyrroline-5-carboxylate dehydrogenase [Marinomonas ostreistagni]|uniref:1-pyrroline-5-carboxylate dehydrogenase n=1 Tax=Marinomonas ostreistagni TaxID=359209 RepID=UPI001952148A|nr:1-pyrroline-5-carboxylate dehydrogenase [Marinomonas ostreistagni]MBM6550617.1 1-pyrroline-5-carboxylate dehydrogenase [Marinomonas ostreistagni]
MTMVKPIQMEVANQVLETWNALGVAARATALARTIAGLNDAQARMAQWQLDNAQAQIGEAEVLPGPTGESNVLSTHGRGAFLVTAQTDLEAELKTVALVGHLYAALVAGNPVITVGPEGQALMDQIAPHVPEGVIQNVAESAQDTIIAAAGLAGVAIVCDSQHAQALSQRLAQKDGLLCQLIEETDTQQLSSVAAPHTILRFVTEQTVTTNTTAIGGNATLLELGSQAE